MCASLLQLGCGGATYHINAECLLKKVCHTTCSHPALLFLTKATASETQTFKPKNPFQPASSFKGFILKLYEEKSNRNNSGNSKAQNLAVSNSILEDDLFLETNEKFCCTLKLFYF